MQQRIRGEIIWIDEAGLVGSRTMAQVFELADKLDARVILSGDKRQHGSVERGAALRLLETEARLVPAEIKEIQRQKERYKQAVLALSEGRTMDGFRQLDEMGWIQEVDDEHRYQVIANDYIDTLQEGESALIVSPTHREAERITRELREQFKDAGKLGKEERTFTTLKNANLTEAERADTANFLPDDVLVFHQNAKGFTKGTRIKLGDSAPPVDQAARFQVFHENELSLAAGDVVRITQNGKTADGKHRLHNGDLMTISGFDEQGNLMTEKGWTISKDYGNLAHGYVVTSHASQGTDVKKVFIAQSADSFAASSREQFYVSLSRGQRQATVYTDSKHDLLDAVRNSDERLSATELFDRRHETVLATSVHRHPELTTSGSRTHQERLHHDR